MSFLDPIRGAALGAIDRVNIAFDPFRQRGGTADVLDSLYKPLYEQDLIAWTDIQDRWLHGPNREFYWHVSRNDLGDMAIWQGFYTAACAFRRDEAALKLALDGIERLIGLGGNSRLSRGADAADGQFAHDASRKYYVDGDYIFTDDCSESSLIGILFGLWAVLQVYSVHSDSILVTRTKLMLFRLRDQLKADGMRLVNQDGSYAKFGDLRPRITTAPIRLAAGACAMLMGEAAGFGRPSEYGDYGDIWRSHSGALLHPETHFLFIHPWYQDVIAYAVLVMQATMAPESVRPYFADALSVMWRKTYKEDNPLYAAMVTLGGRRVTVSEAYRCQRTLEECCVNSGEVLSPKSTSGVDIAPSPDDLFTWGVWKWRKELSRVQVPVWKRAPADFLWQRCPYSIDKQTESFTSNWMDFCLAYSMGKYAGLWR